MASEPINVPIKSTYEDKGAKEAIADAKKIEGLDPTLEIKADDQATAELREVAAAADRLDSEQVNIKVDADTSGAKAGIGDVGDALSGLEGPVGNIGGKLSALATPGGAVAAIGLGLLAAADHAADLAIEADNLANLTGDSVEHASQLAAVWKSTGAEVTDLQDVLLQMNGTLADSPVLAKQLGINLNDGASAGKRFEEVVDALRKIPDANQRAQISSKLFGEEGVRQVNTLIGMYDDLGAAIEDQPSLSAEDAEKARKLKADIKELTLAFTQMATAIGQIVLPVLGTLAGSLNDLFDDAEKLGRGIRTFFDAGARENFKIVEEFEKGRQAARDFDTELLKGLTTFDSVRQKVLEVTGSLDAANVVALDWAENEGAAYIATQKHAQAIKDQADAREAANRQEEQYIAFLEQRGDEAAAQKRVTDQYEQSKNKLAALNVEAERVDRARIANEEANAVEDIRRAYELLRNELSDKKSLLLLQQSFDDLRDKAEAAWTASKEGSEDAEQAQRNFQIAQIDTINQALDYIDTIEGIPDKAITDIQALIDQGKYNEALNALEILSAPRSVFLTARLNESALQQQLRRLGINIYGGGSGSTGSGLAIVGDQGPELVKLPAGAQVVPANVTSAMRHNGQLDGGGVNVTINMPRGSRGVDVLRQVTNQARRSGRRYGVPVVHFARQPDRPGKGGGRK